MRTGTAAVLAPGQVEFVCICMTAPITSTHDAGLSVRSSRRPTRVGRWGSRRARIESFVGRLRAGSRCSGSAAEGSGEQRLTDSSDNTSPGCLSTEHISTYRVGWLARLFGSADHNEIVLADGVLRLEHRRWPHGDVGPRRPGSADQSQQGSLLGRVELSAPRWSTLPRGGHSTRRGSDTRADARGVGRAGTRTLLRRRGAPASGGRGSGGRVAGRCPLRPAERGGGGGGAVAGCNRGDRAAVGGVGGANGAGGTVRAIAGIPEIVARRGRAGERALCQRRAHAAFTAVRHRRSEAVDRRAAAGLRHRRRPQPGAGGRRHRQDQRHDRSRGLPAGRRDRPPGVPADGRLQPGRGAGVAGAGPRGDWRALPMSNG